MRVGVWEHAVLLNRKDELVNEAHEGGGPAALGGTPGAQAAEGSDRRLTCSVSVSSGEARKWELQKERQL